MIVPLNLSDYRRFIWELRGAFAIGHGSTGAVPVEVRLSLSRAFMYDPSDAYLKATLDPTGKWQVVERENYAQMGVAGASVSWPQIQASFLSGYSSGGVDCARIVLATSESARSQVIYQVVQQMRGTSGLSAKWDDLLPLLRNWGKFTKDNHKRKPLQFGPLGLRDYYNETLVQKAVVALREAGFQIDE